MSRSSLFKRNTEYSTTIESLSVGQRIGYVLFTAGAFLPLFFLSIVRPVFWIPAIQMACLAGLAFIRWRSPALRGSVIVVILAALASLVSVIAALAV